MGMSVDGNESGSSSPLAGGGALAEINITPFVDVILVLLIIFMVTAPFAVSGVNIQLPRSQAKPLVLNGEPLVLSVSAKGDYFLGKSPVKAAELVPILRGAKPQQGEASIYIRADKGVPYGRVMEAMGAAQAAGITKIGMMGESAGAKPSK